MSAPLELEEAQARLLALLQPGSSQTLPVDDSAGHFLAAPVIARRNQPPADLSAMDGYATVGPGPWEVVGESRAGAPFPKALSRGMAVRISTGAQMPFPADAVLIQENAFLDGNLVDCTEPPTSRYIRRARMDFGTSDTLLQPGTRIGPAQIALARAGGVAKLVVHQAPRVAVIECGDELCGDPADCPSDQIPAVNGAMLAAMGQDAGAEVKRHGPVADDAVVLTSTIEDAVNAASLIVISGGASVGPHDLVKPALEAAGFTLDFWRVAIKPGKPLLVARRDETVVLGLPGNPVSSFVTGFFFMIPALLKLGGAADCLPRATPMPLAAPLPEGGGRREFLRANLSADGVVAADVQDSSALNPLAHAQVLIDRPKNAAAEQAGAFVPCYPLRNGAYA